MTRLTNAFSKKIENHRYAMALHFLYYNFVRVHQTLKISPAMAAGVTKRLWEMKDVVDILCRLAVALLATNKSPLLIGLYFGARQIAQGAILIPGRRLSCILHQFQDRRFAYVKKTRGRANAHAFHEAVQHLSAKL